MTNSATCVLALALVVCCHSAFIEKRIVGGRPMVKGEWRFLVSLHFNKPNAFSANTGIHHLCAGTLVARDVVVTAAHCFDPRVLPGLDDLTKWEVHVGEYNQYTEDEGEETRRIKRVYKHEGYTAEPLTNDIAIVIINATTESDTFVNEISGFDFTGDFPSGTGCAVAGWGQIADEPFGYPMHIPVVTNVTVIENNVCSREYGLVPEGHYLKKELVVRENNMCAGWTTGGHDACAGDSGGPLICYINNNQVLAGLVSTGFGCGLPEFPGIYTRLAPYADWMVSILWSHVSN